MMLCNFLGDYKEKLLLGKRPEGALDKDIITNEQLKEVKNSQIDHL